MEAPAELPFEGANESVGRARRFAGEALRDTVPESVRDAVLLVVSELTTNAVIHAVGPFCVRVAVTSDRVRLEVEDGSTRAPRRKHYGVDSGTGRGLALVDALAQDWGVDAGATGKTVWAEVSLTEPS